MTTHISGTTGTSPENTENHRVVSRDQWVAERKTLLAREKQLTRLRDQIARERRALPWVRIDKNYVFDTPRAGGRSPTCSKAAANCWSSISCSPRAGSKVARAAPSWPITLTA